MDSFVTLELIGSGSFGKVYKGRRKGTAEIVALKFIPKRSRTSKELQVGANSSDTGPCKRQRRVGRSLVPVAVRGFTRRDSHALIIPHVLQTTKTQILRGEINIMRKLEHDNIVQMLDTFETADQIVAVTEFADGELYQIIEDDKKLPLSTVRVPSYC